MLVSNPWKQRFRIDFMSVFARAEELDKYIAEENVKMVLEILIHAQYIV